MNNIKDAFYYIDHIKQEILKIFSKLDGVSLVEFLNDENLIDSVNFRFIQIAENCSHIDESFKNEHSEIPWHFIRGLRNKIVHEYQIIDFSDIYNTVINDLPLLLEELNKL